MHLPDLALAEAYLSEAARLNPGPWVAHSRNVALAAKSIAARVPGLEPASAEILGLLHDIGRRNGVTGMRHLLDGYLFLAAEGYPDAGRVCLTHSFPFPFAPDEQAEAYVLSYYASNQWDGTPEELETLKRLLDRTFMSGQLEIEYDHLITLCDAISQPDGFCLIEQRLVDVAIRYGSSEKTAERWKGYLQIKDDFERKIGGSIYDLLPTSSPLLRLSSELKRTRSLVRSASPRGPLPLLIIITGLPCSGKSYLAQRIVERFREQVPHLPIPILTKDGIKERLFDSLGWSDRAWSKKMGTVTYELLFYLMEQFLVAGQSLIVESNFYPEFHSARFRAIQQRASFRALEIQCFAPGEVLVERFRQRWERGERHPGHVDPETFSELDATLRRGKLSPLNLSGPHATLEIDTTDFTAIDFERVYRFIEQHV